MLSEQIVEKYEVMLARTIHGEVSLAAADMDHQIRLERSRAFLRHLRP